MADHRRAARATWLSSDRRLARYVAQPITRFLLTEASGGLVLLVASVVALCWANSPWSTGYRRLWATELIFTAGPAHIAMDLRHWVNEGLMALFFFVVGLEIKRELVAGQLRHARDAALPVFAALGGMIVPAAIFLLLTAGSTAAPGWGIPMATDIAFAVGVVVALGDRVPPSLRVLLLGLAIADDIGAIIVIAVVYTHELDVGWLVAAAGGVVLVAVMRRARVWFVPAYVVVGTLLWAFTLESGVHATIAGVALGLLAPARPLLPELEADRVADRLSSDTAVTATDVRVIGFELRESVSVAERLELLLHPWTSYLVIPVFALANAGIPLERSAVSGAAGSRVTLGVVAGLVIGKLAGVSAFAWLSVRLGWARLPADLTWRHIVGIGGLAGLGFTVSIFLSGLAYDDLGLQDEAKIGVLAASILAAALGSVLLAAASRRRPTG